MLSAASIGIRSLFGILLGLFLGVMGFYVGWFVAPPGPTIPTSLVLTMTGVGAAAGGFIGWFKPEVPPWVTGAHVGLVLAGGLAGAWVGWSLGHLIYPEGLYNPASPVRTPPFVVPVVMASGGANLLASSFYVFRLWRNREM